VPLTDSDLDRLESLAAAATPGPWLANENGMGAPMVYLDPHSGKLAGEQYQFALDEAGRLFDGTTAAEPADAAFIAAARTAVPALVAALRAARAELARVAPPVHPGPK
jgi:hypothetical protein